MGLPLLPINRAQTPKVLLRSASFYWQTTLTIATGMLANYGHDLTLNRLHTWKN